MPPRETAEQQTLARRRVLVAGATTLSAGVAGCAGLAGAQEEEDPEEIHTILSVETVKQATRVGVKMKVKYLTGEQPPAPLKITLRSEDGSIITTGYYAVTESGIGKKDTGTKWFDLESVDAVKKTFGADVTLVTPEAYEEATGEHPG